MTDLADILKRPDLPANAHWEPEETEFGQDMRRRADRMPQIPHRLSMSNFLRGMYRAYGDMTDFVYNSVHGRQPVIGMPDLIHTPGQEDYRPAPVGPQHIIAGMMGGVPTRGAPIEDRNRITQENYDAWQSEQEKMRLARQNMMSPKSEPGGGIQPLPRTRGAY